MNFFGRVTLLMRRCFLLLLGLLFLLSGCSSGSFVGKRFDNFTAYYNKFFNAKKKLEAGIEAMERQDQPIDRSTYISIFSANTQAATSAEFHDAIQKGADILREHPDSKWVDDALMLIGQAYFYQHNFVGAEQKFREVIEVSPSLADEARFWLARTLIAAGNYDQANEHLIATLARDDVGRKWQSLLNLAYGELFVRREQWDDAAKQLEQGLEGGPGGDIGARAQFLLGQVYETLGRYEDAVNAFRRVDRYKPLYELSYAARYSAVRILGTHLDPESALKMLRKMENDDKFANNRAELLFLRGRIYQAQGMADEAFYVYDDLLYDSDENIQPVRGRIHYALAELYRDAYQDFQLAAAHFDTARTAISQGSGRSGAMSASAMAERNLFTSEAITDAAELAEMFKSFATVRSEIALMDSLLHIGSLDEEEYQEFVQELRRRRAEEIKAIQREQARRQAERGFQEAGNINRPRQTAQTSQQGDAESGFLFHRNRMRMEDGWMSFIELWGERPHVPNWRRAEAVSALAAAASSRDTLGGATNGSLSDLSLPPVDLSAIPRDSVKQAKMRAERALARYELGNVLFLSMNMPDSAATWYRFVIDEDGEEEVAQRAYFALAEVHRSLGDTLASNRLYQEILEKFPESDYIGEVRRRLGLEAPATVLTDSLILAEAAYADAYALWQAGSYGRALQKMVGVALDYKSTPVAPRALFACGSIYQEWASKDSLDLFAKLPLGVPDSVLLSSGLIKVRMDSSLTAGPALLDSVAVVGGIASDSTALDSLNVPAGLEMDTTLVEDLLPAGELMAVDSTAADSVLMASLDLNTLAADTSGAVTDSLQSLSLLTEPILEAPSREPDNVINLETLYQSLVDGFAQTPFAERARWMLEALAEHKAPNGVADSTTFEIEEGISGDSSLTVPVDPSLIPDEDPDGAAEQLLVPDDPETDSLDPATLLPDGVDETEQFQEDQLEEPPAEYVPDDPQSPEPTDDESYPYELE